MAEQGAENHNPSNDSVHSVARVPMACPNCGKTSISYFHPKGLRFWKVECQHCHASLRLARLFNGYTILAAIYGLALVAAAIAMKETGVLDKLGFVVFLFVGGFVVLLPLDYLAWRNNWVRYIVDNTVSSQPDDKPEEGDS